MRNDTSVVSAAAYRGVHVAAPGGDAPLVVPNYADLNRLSAGRRRLAVPVTRGLT